MIKKQKLPADSIAILPAINTNDVGKARCAMLHSRAHPTKYCYEKNLMFVLRFAKELDDDLHLCPREHLGILLVAYVLHRLPHAARVVHLAAEEAQGRLIAMVGVVHLGQIPEGVIPYLESCHRECVY